MSNSDQTLSSDAIRSGLDTVIIGRRVLYYPRLSSTMDAARDEARKGADEGTVVIADEQTAGRGRLKRSWLGASSEGSGREPSRSVGAFSLPPACAYDRRTRANGGIERKKESSCVDSINLV